MKQYIIPVNGEAMSRAAQALLGVEGAQQLSKAYTTIDEAMNFAFEAGRLDEATKVLAERAEELKNSKDRDSEHEAEKKFMYNAGKDDGYLDGSMLSEEAHQDSFDDGYVEGVHDARVRPEEADEYMEWLCKQDEALPDYADDAAWDELDEAFELQRDSGDETDFERDMRDADRGYNYDEERSREDYSI